MTTLISFLSTGKNTWGHVSLLMNDFARQNFTHEKKFTKIIYDDTKTIPELKDQFRNALKDEKLGLEVAVNLVSGSGKEHMALLSALLQLGVGVRLVALTKEGIKEI